MSVAASIGALALVGSVLGGTAVLTAPAAPAMAATPTVTCTTDPNIFNTGFNAATGGVLPNNAKDANWQVAGMYAPAATVSMPPTNAAWAAANVGRLVGAWNESPYGNANWISQQTIANSSQGGVAGDWYYRYQFNLDPTVDPTQFQLAMDFMADNSVAEVFVNGAAQSGKTTGLPQAPLAGPNPPNNTTSYYYPGFVTAAAASTTLKNDWRTGLNTIIVQIKSGPDAEGFDAQVRPSVLCPDPSFAVTKTAAAASVHPGEKQTYTVTVKNTGNVAYTAANPAKISDDLSEVLDDATYNGDAAVNYSGSSTSAAPTVTGNTLSWSGPLAVGETATITYSVTVDSDDAGDHSLVNAVTPGDGGTCDPAGSCTTTTPVQSYSVTKTADAITVVPGDPITYTVTVKNTGTQAYTADDPASFSDDLSAVLDDATLTDGPSNGATVDGNTLSWSGPLAVGATETITYTVTVNDPITGDSHLDNTVVTPPGTGGDCTTDSDNPACTVNIPSGKYTVAKTASTTEVTAGSTVTYEVVVSNTGDVDYTDAKPASFRDDLSKVLDDAKVTDGPDNGATINGNALSWSGPLAAGQSVTITYTITVDNPDEGDRVIANTVRATGPGGTCDPDADCSTTTNVRTFSIAKTSTPDGEVHPGDEVTYKVTVQNTGTAAFTTADPASFTDDLSKVTDDATITDGPDNGATITGNTLGWSGALDAGDTITITYVATVNTPDTGDHVLSNAAVPGDGGYCDTEGGCSTTNPVGTYKIEKTSSANGVVHAGDTVTYTVTVTNTGKVAYTPGKPAKITDDLSKVLDDTTYVDGSATNGATITGTTLTWSGPLEVDGTQIITYKVKVGPAGTGDGTLTNKVEGDPNTGGSCDPEADCTTTDVLQSLHVTKTADVTEVIPGEKVTYTVTVTNDGASAWTAAQPASVTDDLSNVLDDATYNGDASNGATYDAPTLSWSGPLAVDETATITYSVTVNDPDTGDKILDNTVVTPPGTSCAPGTDNPECSSIVPSGSFTVSKAADKDTVTPGDTITYTVTVKNTGKTAYTDTKPASFSDDLTNVLDDATYNKDASNGATVDGNTLTWEGPLKVSETVKITYSVTVNTPDTGNHRLVNAVVPTGDGGTCDTDGGCMTNTPVRSFTVTKTVSTTDAVKPGDKVGYTVTVKNTGQVAFTTASPASFVDDMSDVLDDATYNGDATHGAKLTGTTLNWAGPLKVAQTIKVTYSVTVKAAGSGNGALVNTVDPPVDGSCDPDGACKTDTAITFPPGATPPGLAFTGTELVGPGIGLALMLLALGGTLLVVRRRRAHGDVQDNA
ncbi:DUF7927 domain-containing protein [Curtobacterium flaccumfaciens]|uniref:DUF7927 domain-containing protein n=1 Tax=Curtobacterium flaccumfaciens TaxID=2035 RepID=UPI001BDF3BBB|nr:DUF11 domain-containing protein [Curtobacterium flaccumfaciens]MBT1681909.1 DUF11 domain-containing protein [Curtobacterium flaccumfaciens pv. flaccumfaciens]